MVDKRTPQQVRQEATSIKEFSTYKATKDRLKGVLDALWQQPDHEVQSKSGVATAALMELLPAEILGSSQRHGDRITRAAFINAVRDMAESGFIGRETNGKRTYRIYLTDKVPTDWTPPEVKVSKELDWSEEEEVQAVSVLNPNTSGFVVEPTPPTLEVEARDGGIRPGRLAARLERIEEGLTQTIPALVEEGVTEGIKGFFVQFAAAMGFEAAPNVDVSEYQGQVDELVMRLQSANSLVNELKVELRSERTAGHAAREELNKILRSQQATKEMSPVQPSDLQEAWRDLGRLAIANGWTIHRTGGGHLQWRSPLGFRYFSSATSSDYRSVRNARADMEKEGLPSV